MGIEDKILVEKPREESGPKTSKKYRFQKDLSLFLMIQEHKSRGDYLFLFDFHEDLIISSSSSNLKDLECIQIKSKDKGNWTINDITNKQKGECSILAKLYCNKNTFESSVKYLTFISNAKYSFRTLKNADDSLKRNEIFARELNDEALNKCNECICNEHSLTNSEFEMFGKFSVTNLSNLDSSTHCVGALADLIHFLNPENKINAQLAYEQVHREISKRTEETVGDKTFKHISEIFKLKGLTKADFTNFLNKAGLYKSIEDDWNEIKTSLESSGISYMELVKFKNGWREMSARLIRDSTNIPLLTITSNIENMLKQEETVLYSLNLLEIVNHIFDLIQDKSFGEYVTKSLIISKVNES